jgi:glutathione S-transferase
MASTELKTYVTCSAILYAKFVIATGIQATKTFDTGGRPPEDKNLPLAKGRPEQTYGLVQDEKLAKARETELRWRRIVQNDLESIPIGLLVFGAGVLAKGNSTVHATAMIAYTSVRCFHTYAYAHALHPHRALCWLFGVIAMTVGVGNALYGVFTS